MNMVESALPNNCELWGCVDNAGTVREGTDSSDSDCTQLLRYASVHV